MIPPIPEKPIRVLCCPRLDRQGASSRYRSFQYLPYLREHGFQIDVVPLFSEKYLRVRYAKGHRSLAHMAPAYARRWFRLRQCKKYDLIWTEKELLPWMPRWIESLSLPRTVPYVVDYDDAEFHRYDNHRLGAIRLLLGKKINEVMRGAAMVIAGNDYIAEHARRAGASHVELLPTVVDLDRYPPAPPPRNDVFTIGWIGTPITARFLQLVAPVLREICRGGAARLVTIGSGPLDLPGVPVEVRPWSEETEVRDIRQFDVGIMPLPDNPHNRGKCGLKLIQYLACGRPVVGTPIGVNTEIIRHDENGFQASTVEEWTQSLERLRADPTLRETMGRNGRELVEQRYSLAVAAPRLAEMLRAAATGNGNHAPSLCPKKTCGVTVTAAKTRLVHVATVPGTLWTFLDGQIGFMKRHGIEVEAVSSPGDRLDKFAAREQVAVHGVEMPRRITPWQDCASIVKLWRLLRNIRPTIVHSHTPKGGLLGMIAAWAARTPVRIYHIRGLPLMTAAGIKRHILRCTEWTSCRLAHQILCVSPSVAHEAVALGLCPAEKIHVLGSGGNGVDAQGKFNRERLPAGARRRIRAAHDIPEDAPVIGFVGRIVRDKGCVELAEAWQSLRESFPTSHLLMVGPFEPQDPLPGEVETLLRNDRRVHLTGRIADTSEYYNAMDVLALPTYREGFPNVAVEAAAMELPVVATRIPGCVDAVVDGATGVLVPPRDAAALSEAIRAYFADPELRRRHGRAGRQRVLSDFRREEIWRELHELYVELLQRQGLQTPADRAKATIPAIPSCPPKRRAA